ncbi:MAG: HD domain-containing protein [Candidatus Scalindua sp. AMX11]|nr:MAG: HD domain-containing protein [Candidatus Scalindua sp.]NOG83394.1 HD domain-containing protein [Planctomycetota bacterium]RZV75101.1 MAG: HD domain-containing protein [Candidatus Scalindua sp. SCAELEC01]TDE63502.1 MAG: HD domain-containing protein [Candidatus Scalindua sp. AMX11]
MKKLIKQNRAFLSTITILFVIFAIVLYFGSNKIYEREAKWRHGNAISQLHSAKENLKQFFADLEHDLFFLRNISSSKEYVNSNYESMNYKSEVEKLLYEFAKVCKHYYQISIIDTTGYEVIRIDNRPDKTPLITPKAQLQNRKYKDYYQKAMKLDNNQIYVSSIHSGIQKEEIVEDNLPMIELAMPLFSTKNEKKGVLVLNMFLSRLLKILPENMFIQAGDGNLISLRLDGSINFNESHYDFSDSSGWIDISDDETIHYTDVEILPGKKLVVAIFHKHPMLKALLQRLIVVSIILLSIFLCLILIIGYLNFLRFRELIGAQRAIIFSLAKLAEHRDSGTGDHLERTRGYSIILAKQLRKNKKYKRIITDEFIEDLYDAAPLHDIGKVGIRDSILLKESKLTEEEYGKMKGHVQMGGHILQDAIDIFKLKQSFLVMGKNICAYHHEQYNGKGYPDGLKGEEITVEARIFALCDAYDAIRSSRSYKDEQSHKDAVKRIRSDRGEHFDPDIVDAFLECENEFSIEVTQNLT